MITGGGNRTTWTLTVTPPATVASSAPVVSPATQLSFLGYGLATPFRRGSANDFAAAGGSDLVKSRLSQVIGTACSTPESAGELLWRGDFGTRLNLLRHRSNTAFLAKLAYHWVLEGIAKWEPNARGRGAGVIKNPAKPRELTLRIGYDVVSTNPAGNRVILPGETLDVPLAPTAG